MITAQAREIARDPGAPCCRWRWTRPWCASASWSPTRWRPRPATAVTTPRGSGRRARQRLDAPRLRQRPSRSLRKTRRVLQLTTAASLRLRQPNAASPTPRSATTSGSGTAGHRAEEPGRLAVDPIEEVERVGVAAVAGAAAEHESPQPARSVARRRHRSGSIPSNAPVRGSNALITLLAKLKLPTSRSPPNWPNPAGASARPHGAASWLPETSLCRKPPFSSKTLRNPAPGAAALCAARPAGA